MGGHKVGGNYAPGMLPLRIAQEAGYAQVREKKISQFELVNQI